MPLYASPPNEAVITSLNEAPRRNTTALQVLFAELNANATEPIDVDDSDAEGPMDDGGEESTLYTYIYMYMYIETCCLHILSIFCVVYIYYLYSVVFYHIIVLYIYTEYM